MSRSKPTRSKSKKCNFYKIYKTLIPATRNKYDKATFAIQAIRYWQSYIQGTNL
jgi:hypothetical protein